MGLATVEGTVPDLRRSHGLADKPGSLPVLLAVIFVASFLSHIGLVRLPYLWDEAGYYIPAARDLLLSGSLIPRSTVSNAHPPLVMIWLATWWKIFGFAPLVTRSAMLLVATFTLAGVFRLARWAANLEVAIASTVCTGLYSVFFCQSSMAHLDMAAAGFTLWGLLSHLRKQRARSALWFSLACLAKETAILAPLALLVWDSAQLVRAPSDDPQRRERWTALFWLLFPGLPLAGWFGYHWTRTGYLFGNPEYFRYNVSSTLHPLRVMLAMATRLWQLLGYMNMWLLTAAMLFAMLLPPRRDSNQERPRISFSVQMTFYVVIAAYLIAMAAVGGALLARYLLPVYPLWIIVCVATLWRRVRYWGLVVSVIVAGFVLSIFINPPYGFAFEDNLAYRDYIRLHEDAETYLEARYPMARVLTAWPASDEISRPYLGYLSRPMKVVQVDNFSFEHISAASDLRNQYDVALVFSTKYVPLHSLLAGWPEWERLQRLYFGFHRDLPPAAAAQVLGGDLVYGAARNGQWIAVIRMEPVVDARIPNATAGGRNGF